MKTNARFWGLWTIMAVVIAIVAACLVSPGPSSSISNSGKAGLEASLPLPMNIISNSPVPLTEVQLGIPSISTGSVENHWPDPMQARSFEAGVESIPDFSQQSSRWHGFLMDSRFQPTINLEPTK